MNTKRITAKTEDLAVHGVDGRLGEAFSPADVLTELVDDLLYVPEHPYTISNQLVALGGL